MQQQNRVPKQRRGQQSPIVFAKRKKVFLESLADCGMVHESAARCGIHTPTLYSHRKTDPEFAAAWQEALEKFGEKIEAAARQRAIEGHEEPVYQGGRLVGYIRKYSDLLLRDMLRARVSGYKPEPANVQVINQAPIEKESDPTKIAMKIAYALAVAKKNQEKLK